jgi:hypothetical protein
VRRVLLLAVLVAVLLPGVASGAGPSGASGPTGPTGASGVTGPVLPASGVREGPTDPNAVEPVGDLNRAVGGHRLNGTQVQAIADRLPAIREELRRHPGAYPGVYLKGQARWQVSYFSRETPPKELAQVLVDDATGRVTEAWTGYKVAWTMARGYDGAFGRKVNSPWVMIPLAILFIAPFVQWRRPLRLLHLDLLVLLGFALSLHFFTVGNVDAAVPIVAPLLAYVLGRMLWIGLRRGPEPAEVRRPLPLAVPVVWLAVACLFLIGFRIGLNATSSNVIDVGYASVVGADRLAHGERLYGAFPQDIVAGDTYGTVTYAAYVPFEAAFPWSGRNDDLTAAHVAAVAFDLLCVLLLFLVGRRIRGPGLGIVLAYAWLTYPFTIYASNTNANDALVPLALLGTLLVAGRPLARGAGAALAGLTKFASLAVAPVLLTYREERTPLRVRDLAVFSVGFVVAAAVALLPVVLDGPSLREVYDRTIGYQAGRDAPFSIWGLYDLDTLQAVWQGAAIMLALVVAVLPRRRDLVGLAALLAAVLTAFELGATYWFYLYLVWLFPFAAIALFGRYAEPARA